MRDHVEPDVLRPVCGGGGGRPGRGLSARARRNSSASASSVNGRKPPIRMKLTGAATGRFTGKSLPVRFPVGIPEKEGGKGMVYAAGGSAPAGRRRQNCSKYASAMSRTILPSLL
jgi:hypothetical protein